jgi:hypothetical protein
MDMQKIVERVKKMLEMAKGKAEGGEHERENAMRMVHAYLAKYNLDMATVEGSKSQQARKQEESEGGPRTHHPHQFFGRPWARCAAAAVADLCFCMYLYRSARVSKDCTHLFIGRTANAVTASYLAEYVCVSIHQEGRRRQRREGLSNPWFLDFAWGAAMIVQERCKLLKQSAGQKVNGSAGTELVLMDYYKSERAANADYQQVAFPRLKTGSMGKGVRGTGGYAEGREYGSTINLNRQMK